MDFDYEEADEIGGRILWPRIIVFGAALLLALILGRCTAGGGGVPQEDLDTANARITELETQLAEEVARVANRDARIAQLEGQVEGTAPGTETTGTPGTTEGGAETPTDDSAATTDAEGNRIYEVQGGDTLSSIAQTVYGDPGAFGIIADANNITGSNTLQVGDMLIIPDNPDAN